MSVRCPFDASLSVRGEPETSCKAVERVTGLQQRYAVVGVGARAEVFVRAIVCDHADTARLVAFADPAPVRLAAHNRWLEELHHPPVATYPATAFDTMLTAERVVTVIVTSVDATHDTYIVAALRAGRAVITEKPMTVDAQRCARILATERE